MATNLSNLWKKHCITDPWGYTDCLACAGPCNNAIKESAEEHNCLIAYGNGNKECYCGRHVDNS